MGKSTKENGEMVKSGDMVCITLLTEADMKEYGKMILCKIDGCIILLKMKTKVLRKGKNKLLSMRLMIKYTKDNTKIDIEMALGDNFLEVK